MALCSFPVPRTVAGHGCIQHFGRESEPWGTDLSQVFLRTPILAQAMLKVLETLFHPSVTASVEVSYFGQCSSAFKQLFCITSFLVKI